ncbi:hypothetical protein [Sodalis-like endosymbiont of Proechinophthirus fluctus]
MAKCLLSYFPEHKCYVKPFCGGAELSFQLGISHCRNSKRYQ